MSQSIAILGRQPALGLAELESLYGAEAIRLVGNAAVIELAHSEVAFDRLGGTLKLAKMLTILDTTEWPKIVSYLVKTIPEHLGYIPEGKIRLGLSVYGLSVRLEDLNRSGLQLKKVIKNNGRSVRVVPNVEAELNTAQVLHNQLTGPTGLELLLIKDGHRTHLAQTVRVQDINAYAARDQARPKRDARVGMLPPKLAQIIINLAVGALDGSPGGAATILDPFCGTGVVLQEASLMGYNVYGTDLEPRMVDYSRANLDWLNITAVEQRVAQGDATNCQWAEPFSVIAAETYLGRPFSADPRPDVLQEVMQDVNLIHKKFLQNVARQTAPGFRLCLAVPAWHTRQGFKHLKVLDSLEDLGYTRMDLTHVSHDQLLYYRPDQIVARELVVLIRK